MVEFRSTAEKAFQRFQRLVSLPNRQAKSTTVTFTGGLGAQILSFAIVLDFRSRGIPVGADLSYFLQTPKIAEPGGSVSIWPWALDEYGLGISDVRDLCTARPGGQSRLLHDSPEKLQLALEALQKSEVRSALPAKPVSEVFRLLGITEVGANQLHAAFHLRRGDYLNVSSHVVAEEEYLRLVPKIAKVTPAAIVVSDSILSSDLHDSFRLNFDQVTFLEGHAHDARFIHHLLRNAPIHVGSNGTFSLTAGLLGEGLWLSPSVWFGGSSSYDAVLKEYSSFEARLV